MDEEFFVENFERNKKGLIDIFDICDILGVMEELSRKMVMGIFSEVESLKADRG